MCVYAGYRGLAVVSRWRCERAHTQQIRDLQNKTNAENSITSLTFPADGKSPVMLKYPHQVSRA